MSGGSHWSADKIIIIKNYYYSLLLTLSAHAQRGLQWL